MALANGKADIVLDGHGYILQEESYRKKAQPAFNPRFSTGDPSETDLSFWQFQTQDTWDGGAGQDIFTTVNKIKSSYGWSFLTGKPRLAGGNSAPAGITTPTAAPDVEVATITDLPRIMQAEVFGRDTIDKPEITLCTPTTAYAIAGTNAVLRAASVALVGINQFNASCCVKWRRQDPSAGGGAGWLATGVTAAGTNYVRVIDEVHTSVSDTTPATTFIPRCIIPVTQDKILAFGSATYSGQNTLAACLIVLTAGNWGAGSAVTTVISDVPSIPSPYGAIDSNGVFYVVLPGERALTSSEFFGSSVLTMTAADAVLTNGPANPVISQYPDYILTGALAINGTIYLLGYSIKKTGSSPTYRSTLLKFPRTKIWESEHTSTTLSDVIPRCMYQAGRTEAYFIDRKLDGGQYQAILRLGLNDAVEEVASIAQDVTGTRLYPAALVRIANSFYVYDVSQNRFILADTNPASTRAATSGTCRLKLSKFAGNTPSITKTLYSVTVQLSEALPANETLTVKVNDTTVGTMVTASGTRKEIVLTTEITSANFQPVLEMVGTSTWPGEIQIVSLKYVPTQYKKLAWGFGIRATKGLKQIDGTKDQTPTTTLFSQLIAAWSSNVPITFTDVDGTDYTVLITDFDQRRPLLDRRGGTNAEAIFYLELLQI